jgi:hypothetical protein
VAPKRRLSSQHQPTRAPQPTHRNRGIYAEKRRWPRAGRADSQTTAVASRPARADHVRSSGKSGSDLLAQQCLSLIKTADDIYAVQGGAATLIASGVGGSLAAAESLTLDCG